MGKCARYQFHSDMFQDVWEHKKIKNGKRF